MFHSRYSHLLLIAAHLESLLFLVERPDFKWGPESYKCSLYCYLLMTSSLLPSSTYNYYSTVLYTFQCSKYILSSFYLRHTSNACRNIVESMHKIKCAHVTFTVHIYCTWFMLAHIMIEKAKKLSLYIQLCMYYMNTFE